MKKVFSSVYFLMSANVFLILASIIWVLQWQGSNWIGACYALYVLSLGLYMYCSREVKSEPKRTTSFSRENGVVHINMNEESVFEVPKSLFNSEVLLTSWKKNTTIYGSIPEPLFQNANLKEFEKVFSLCEEGKLRVQKGWFRIYRHDFRGTFYVGIFNSAESAKKHGGDNKVNWDELSIDEVPYVEYKGQHYLLTPLSTVMSMADFAMMSIALSAIDELEVQ